MKIELKLQTDTHNTYCENLVLSFEIIEDRDYVWVQLEGREVAVKKEEFKKLLSII